MDESTAFDVDSELDFKIVEFLISLKIYRQRIFNA